MEMSAYPASSHPCTRHQRQLPISCRRPQPGVNRGPLPAPVPAAGDSHSACRPPATLQPTAPSAAGWQLRTSEPPMAWESALLQPNESACQLDVRHPFPAAPSGAPSAAGAIGRQHGDGTGLAHAQLECFQGPQLHLPTQLGEGVTALTARRHHWRDAWRCRAAGCRTDCRHRAARRTTRTSDADWLSFWSSSRPVRSLPAHSSAPAITAPPPPVAPVYTPARATQPCYGSMTATAPLTGYPQLQPSGVGAAVPVPPQLPAGTGGPCFQPGFGAPHGAGGAAATPAGAPWAPPSWPALPWALPDWPAAAGSAARGHTLSAATM